MKKDYHCLFVNFLKRYRKFNFYWMTWFLPKVWFFSKCKMKSRNKRKTAKVREYCSYSAYYNSHTRDFFSPPYILIVTEQNHINKAFFFQIRFVAPHLQMYKTKQMSTSLSTVRGTLTAKRLYSSFGKVLALHSKGNDRFLLSHT